MKGKIIIVMHNTVAQHLLTNAKPVPEQWQPPVLQYKKLKRSLLCAAWLSKTKTVVCYQRSNLKSEIQHQTSYWEKVNSVPAETRTQLGLCCC